MQLRSALFASFFLLLLLFWGLTPFFSTRTWRPVLMVEEETGKSTERTTDPREATGKLSHISTFAES
jgi:hypothetical protein